MGEKHCLTSRVVWSEGCQEYQRQTYSTVQYSTVQSSIVHYSTETNLPCPALSLLLGVTRVEAGTVRGTGATREQRPALVTPQPSRLDLLWPLRGHLLWSTCGHQLGPSCSDQLRSSCSDQLRLCLYVVVSDAVTEVVSTEAGGDGVLLLRLRLALGLGLDGAVQATQQDAGGETFSDH